MHVWCLHGDQFSALLGTYLEGTLPPHLFSMLCCSWLASWFAILVPWLLGEGNGNPLQYSCLENPRDRGAEGIVRNAGLEDTQAGLKMAGRNSDPLRYADDTTLMAAREEGLKSLLRKGKEESEHVGLKLHIQKTKIMACGPIVSWERDGEPVETGSDFILGGSRITEEGDCSHDVQRRGLLGRKGMTNLDSIFQSSDVTLPTKVRLVKAMVFPCSWMDVRAGL